MHYLAVYHWLEYDGNLWKAVVGVCVAGIITWLLGIKAWLGHRKTQAEIADRLNTDTPGGLSDLVQAINRLERAHEADTGSSGPGSGLRGEHPARQDDVERGPGA